MQICSRFDLHVTILVNIKTTSLVNMKTTFLANIKRTKNIYRKNWPILIPDKLDINSNCKALTAYLKCVTSILRRWYLRMRRNFKLSWSVAVATFLLINITVQTWLSINIFLWITVILQGIFREIQIQISFFEFLIQAVISDSLGTFRWHSCLYLLFSQWKSKNLFTQDCRL